MTDFRRFIERTSERQRLFTVRATLHNLLLTTLLLAALSQFARAADAEWRALWVDTFRPGLHNEAEVTRLVADARAGNFNALFVEVRKRADAYYQSSFEPKATDVSPPNYDPLADLLAKARSGGPRLQVHAWMTTYLAWNNRTNPPPQPEHPYRLHPEWLSQDFSGAHWDGKNFQFDAAHPEVQRHVFNVALDLLGRYDVDGLHFDYVRYSDRDWGYHPVAVARFNTLTGRTGKPAPADPDWLQFRRDQVTDLVRKTYLTAATLRPQAVISAATICWAPGPVTDADWLAKSAAWNKVLQDWRGWMEEGILDLNVPMTYFRQSTYGADWARWSQFIKNHRHGRHSILGAGAYLNSAAHSLGQLRSARVATHDGQVADGVAVYSYNSMGTNVTRAQFLAALTRPSAYETNRAPIFETFVEPPSMPWKLRPTLGHLRGFVRGSVGEGKEVDGAIVRLVGPVSRQTRTDATGHYGFAGLPPGDYRVAVGLPASGIEPLTVTIRPGMVSRHDAEVR